MSEIDAMSAAEILQGLPNRISDAGRCHERRGVDGARRPHLTSYKPSEIVILNSFPAASTGKALKHKLWEAAQAAKSRGKPAVAAHGVA